MGRGDHRSLADGQCRRRHLREERVEAVLPDLPFAEAVTAPGHAAAGDDLVAVAGVEEPAVFVLWTRQHPLLVVGDADVAAGAGGGSHRTAGREVRRRLGRLGSPQDLGAGPLGRPRPGLPVVGAPGHGPAGLVAAGPLPGRAPPAGPGTAGSVRCPPTRRKRVWQTDFTDLETTAGGTWRIGGVCDYWAKPALAGRVAATATATDLSRPWRTP